jgi:hypothetical protein
MSHSIIRKFSCFFFICLIILEIASIFLNSIDLYHLYKENDKTQKPIFIFNPKLLKIIVISYNLISICSILILGLYSIYTKRLNFLYTHIIFCIIAILLIVFNLVFFYENEKKTNQLILFILNIIKGVCYIFNIIMVILECIHINYQLSKSLLNMVDDNLTQDMFQSILDSSKSFDSERFEREYERFTFRQKQNESQKKSNKEVYEDSDSSSEN